MHIGTRPGRVPGGGENLMALRRPVWPSVRRAALTGLNVAAQVIAIIHIVHGGLLSYLRSLLPAPLRSSRQEVPASTSEFRGRSLRLLARAGGPLRLGVSRCAARLIIGALSQKDD